jgi:hypothetical protein
MKSLLRQSGTAVPHSSGCATSLYEQNYVHRQSIAQRKAAALSDVSMLATFTKYAAEPLCGFVPRKVQAVLTEAGTVHNELPTD